jgi:hypothetical protein
VGRGGRHRTYPKSEEREENETISKLKSANRRLKSDNERLKAEISTLEAAFKQTSRFIKNNSDNISIESIIDGVKSGKNLKEIQTIESCEKCGSGDVKELSMGKVGVMKFCNVCKHRDWVYREEDKKE